jgi:hypothetical protein
MWMVLGIFLHKIWPSDVINNDSKSLPSDPYACALQDSSLCANFPVIQRVHKAE